MGRIVVLEQDRLPCGCVIGTALEGEKRVAFIKPCSETCKFYAYMHTETRKQGKSIEYLEG